MEIQTTHRRSRDLLQLIILVAPYLFIVYYWSQMPDRIATHWGFNGQPNGYMPKAVGSLLLPTINIGIALLLANIHRIDPSRSVHQMTERTLRIVRYSITGLVSLLSIATVLLSVGIEFPMNRVVLALVTVFFIVLGVALPNVPRNYFVGVRLPWTLEDDENWKATNGLAGKIMMLGGMIALPLVLLLPDPAAEIALGVLIAAVVIVPAVFSYRFFRRTKRG